jgi:uncharacterized YkwD family protein
MTKNVCYDEFVDKQRIFSKQEDVIMFKKKAILTVAAAAALLMANPMQNNAQAASNSPTDQQRVYVYKSTNVNEFNRMLEDFFGKMGMDKNYAQFFSSQNTVTQPTQTVPQQPSQVTAPKPVQQQPVPADQPTTTQTTSSLSAYEQKVVDLTNQERVKNGLSPLKVDVNLSKMAREKSRDMSANGYFSHTSPTYGSPFDMMKQYGITYRYAGENIAMGQRTPAEVVNAWMNSEGHRKNILSSNFTHIGVGYVAQGNYWTQEFIGK